MTSSIVDLGKDEAWFWATEPRIVINLIEQKKEIDRERMKTQSAYISCCVWGKNPDDLDPPKNVKKEIVGIDKPVNPAMLRGFY